MKHETVDKGRRRINQAAFDRIEKAGSKPVVVLKTAWKLAIPPGAHILRKYLKTEYEVATLLSGKGWLVKRV